MPRPIALTDNSVYLNRAVTVPFLNNHGWALNAWRRFRHPCLYALGLLGFYRLEWDFFNRHMGLLVGQSWPAAIAAFGDQFANSLAVFAGPMPIVSGQFQSWLGRFEHVAVFQLL